MVHVAIHELKSGLSRYLQQARAGQTVVVTSHDRPVARIVGVVPADASGVERLLCSGAATWSGRKPELLPLLALSALSGASQSLSLSVIEDRG